MKFIDFALVGIVVFFLLYMSFGIYVKANYTQSDYDGLAEGYFWIRDNTPTDSILISKPSAGMTMENVEVPLSERRAYLGDMNEALITFVDQEIVDKRKAEIEYLYFNCIVPESILEFENVYMLYRKYEVVEYGLNCRDAFETVFDNGYILVLRVK